jgi:hypothetical protein
MINMEQPAAVNGLLTAFLDQISGQVNEGTGGTDERHANDAAKRTRTGHR